MSRPARQPPGEFLDNSGSPAPGEPLFLRVGKILRPHGVHGQVLLSVVTDFPERLIPGKEVFAGEGYQPLEIQDVRWHQNKLLVTFDGLQDRDSALSLSNLNVYVSAQNLPALPDGEYYHHQLLGLDVENTEGQRLGKLMEILETGANDVYLVKDESGQEMLLPAIEDVILEINLPENKIIAQPLAWYNE